MTGRIVTTKNRGEFRFFGSWGLRRCGLVLVALSALPVVVVALRDPPGDEAWESVHDLFEGLALAFSLFGLVLARIRLQREVEAAAAAVVVLFVVIAVAGVLHSAISMGLLPMWESERGTSWSVLSLLGSVTALGGAVAAGNRESPLPVKSVGRMLLLAGGLTFLFCVSVITFGGAGPSATIIQSAVLALLICGLAAFSLGLFEMPRGPQGEALMLCIVPLAVTVIHDLYISGRHDVVKGAIGHYLEIVVLSTLLAGLLAQYSEVHRRQGEVRAELKRRRTELNAAHVERDRLFAASNDLICYADTKGYFVELNLAWEEALGWSIPELKGSPFVEFVHPDDREKTVVETRQLGRFDYETVRFLNRYRCRDGSYRWLQWNATTSDELGMIVAIARDVTEEREIQEKLEEYAAELARSNAELEQFAHVASHDLQEPLRKVQSFADLLIHRYASEISEQPMSYIRLMASATERMQQLIRDLLMLSRLSAQDLRDEPVDLSLTMQAVLSDLEVAIQEADCRVTVEPLPTVLANSRYMHQLLLNIVSNAIKYRREDVTPEITIRAAESPEGPLVLITDNGIGFDPGYAERIFQIFERVNQSNHEGTGIGLALCRRIMERHGGAVTATGEPGHGATFRVCFPWERSIQEEVKG